MENKIRKVEVYNYKKEVEYTAVFHGFFQSCQELYDEPNIHCPVAIIEKEDGQVKTISPDQIKFIKE